MPFAIIQNEVKDFDEWKKIFDADQPAIAAAGAKLLGVYREIDNPNKVTIMYEAPNVELYHTLMSDPERQAQIQQAGVISQPTAVFLNKVE
mgnify:CR=1 FL=1